MALPEVEKIRGENATMEVDGLAVIIDGDIELNMEKEVYEWKPRNVATTVHIPSKRVTISGSISGVPTDGITTVLEQFLGTSKIDGSVTFDNIDLPNVTITYTFTDSSDKVTLSDVHLKSLKVSAKDGEVIRVEAEFVANAISLS